MHTHYVVATQYLIVGLVPTHYPLLLFPRKICYFSCRNETIDNFKNTFKLPDHSYLVNGCPKGTVTHTDHGYRLKVTALFNMPDYVKSCNLYNYNHACSGSY